MQITHDGWERCVRGGDFKKAVGAKRIACEHGIASGGESCVVFGPHMLEPEIFAGAEQPTKDSQYGDPGECKCEDSYGHAHMPLNAQLTDGGPPVTLELPSDSAGPPFGEAPGSASMRT